MIFSERLVNLRKQRNLTQKEVYDGIMVKGSSYQRYEYGRIPTAEILCKLADFFDVSTDYLLCRTDKPEVNR